jgi:hypothetical protein
MIEIRAPWFFIEPWGFQFKEDDFVNNFFLADEKNGVILHSASKLKSKGGNYDTICAFTCTFPILHSRWNGTH